ncbi:MAG: YceI family protein [Alteromonadaceae bacterium]|nr:YceI family protein [Alteromonadaceae bacterium]
MKKTLKTTLIVTSLMTTLLAPLSHAANYVIDTKGAHASINFKIKHLGYSWLTGRFDKFSGKFNYDADHVNDSKIEVNIDTTSVNTNHAERNKHLKSADFLEVNNFATAKFTSTNIIDKGNDKLEITGILSLHGISKNIVIDAVKIGEGKDPWGGYRVGFSGTTTLTLKDFAIKMDLGPASSQVILTLNIEGVRVK